MPTTIEGTLSAAGLRFAIVASRFNGLIVEPLVAGEAARGIAGAAHASTIPVSFGVLTTDTIEQALERAGTKAGNKGFDAALAAIELATLFKALSSGPRAAKKAR